MGAEDAPGWLISRKGIRPSRIRGQNQGEATIDNGIIGAGLIGGTLARKLAAARHRVRIANSKDPSTLREFDEVAGITPMGATDAVDGAGTAILSIPEKAVGALADDLVLALSTVPIVIDTGNYYPVRDGSIAALDSGLADSEWVASRLGRPVFKAFNTSAPRA